MYYYNRCFNYKTIISKEKSSSGLLFTAKILQEAMYFTSPIWAKPLTKFNPNLQDFKHVLDSNCRQKKKTGQPNFFNWLSNVKNLVFSNKGAKSQGWARGQLKYYASPFCAVQKIKIKTRKTAYFLRIFN